MKLEDKNMLKDYLRVASVNCSNSYVALNYWVKKYWKSPEKHLIELKKLGKCDHEVWQKL